MVNFREILIILLCICCSYDAWAELQAETIPKVLKLPESYPDTWIYGHDMNFTSIVDGKVVVLDVAAGNRNYKGQ